MAASRPPRRPSRILIAEAHEVLRGVIRLACEESEDLLVVGEAIDGGAAFALCRALEPDVLVLDLWLPGEPGGLDLVRALREEGSGVRILVVTSRSDETSVLESIRAGADGYLERSAVPQAIVSALLRLAAGERAFSQDMERGAVRELGRVARRARESSGARASITARELEVLEYLSLGLTVKQVAVRLGLSPRTVESHVGKLYRKLRVRNRVQAISRASSLGLIEVP